jgi:hypothetical protein
MATGPDDAQEYICELEEQLNDAKLALDLSKATLDSYQQEYTRTNNWLIQLKLYCDAISKTDDLARGLKVQLENTLNQTKIAGDVTCYAVDAYRWMLLDLETVAKCTEALKIYIKELMDTFPTTLDAKDPVREAYQKLLDCLSAAMLQIAEALALLLAALEKVELLWKGVGDPGLSKYLSQLAEYFCTATPKPEYYPPCEYNCDKPIFPLSDNKNTYYTTTMDACESVAGDLAELKTALDEAQRDKNTKQTCYDALKAALTAAQAAKACKTK